MGAAWDRGLWGWWPAHLVNSDAVRIGHLIKLVDTADPTIRQDHSTRLKPPLASVVILGHRRCETDAARAAAGGRDRERRNAQDKAQ